MSKHLALLLLLLCSTPAWAELKARWDQTKDRFSLRISVADSLTEQQKKLLYSGFSTFSHLEVRWLDGDVRRSLVFISECTIKFDLWEEKFDLLHFLERRQSNSLQSFQQYVDLCLQADISSQSNIAHIASQGARLEVRLDISQVSSEFAQDVRGWLIQQQSGVMRGLFSHMLGDLKLSESIQKEVIAPPLAPPPEKKGAVVVNRKNLHLAWYQTTVVRAVGFATLIILGGYLGGLNSIRQALHSLAQMAYDDDLDQALSDYMDSLKELDTSKRQTLLLEMKSIIGGEPIHRFNEERIRDLLMKADINSLAPIDRIKIEPLREKITGPDLAWLTRTELRVGRYLVSVPVSEVRQRFEVVQQVKQKYELIEATWDREIAPSLLLTNGLILVGTFSLVGLVLVGLVRRYVRNVQEVLRGFRRWSERDPSFRLPLRLSGEMSVIAAQFNAMADEVEMNRRKTLYLEKISSWQTMARKLAHEIKNPLTPIQMMVNQLQRKYKGEDAAFQQLLDEASKIIHEEVNALRRMVDHFSQFARLPDPKWEEADLLRLCQQLLELEKAAFPEHELVLETKLASAPIMMDSQLMKQVIMNLIKNAAEASTGQTAHIQVQLERTDAHYVIQVVDDGPGIREEDQVRIFEAYYTTKHTGPNPGMGLGLAICKKIVMDHQGELTVTSRPGQTIFRIQLPSEQPNEVLSL